MATRYRVWFTDELGLDQYLAAEFYFQSALANCKETLIKEARDRGLRVEIRASVVRDVPSKINGDNG